MKEGYLDRTPKISLFVLATLCFVTLVMCQTRFKISKELSEELYPPVLRSRDSWFLYTIGNPDSLKCVLRIFVVISSPILSLISTGLLLFGKMESNPYFFIPWLFLTLKGLLLVQTDNLITILRDMTTRSNYTFGFRIEDLKWLIFYFTIFLVDILEAFSFCEVFDLFLVLWNHHPGFDKDTPNLEEVKKNIADIMEAFSKCSLGSLSKISLGSLTDSDENVSDLNDMKSIVRLREDEKLFECKGTYGAFPAKVDTNMKSTFESSTISKDCQTEHESKKHTTQILKHPKTKDELRHSPDIKEIKKQKSILKSSSSIDTLKPSKDSVKTCYENDLKDTKLFKDPKSFLGFPNDSRKDDLLSKTLFSHDVLCT